MFYRFTLSLIAFYFLITFNSFAWIYPEHRDITLKAISYLSEEKLNLLNKYWAISRTKYEGKLSKELIDTNVSDNLNKIDFVSLPAIGGDHSCSPDNMINSVIPSDWIVKVARIASELKLNISSLDLKDKDINTYKILNYIRDADIQIQQVDPDYANRSRANFSHFLLAYDDHNITLDEYIDLCTKEGTPLNIVGAYSLFHLSALMKASYLQSKDLIESQRAELIFSMLSDESFALHLLEDGFASGHTAGIWGDVAQRKGTHDYYNIIGLKTNSWDKEIFTITGDAYIRKQDIDRAAITIKTSLEQVLDMSTSPIYFCEDCAKVDLFTPNNFDLCSESVMPRINFKPEYLQLLKNVLIKTPMPGLAMGIGELPRFRAEIGMFGGLTSSINASVISNSFAQNQNYSGVIPGAEASLKFGIGFDDVLNDAGDGLAFLSVGMRLDGSSTSGVVDDPETQNYGVLLSSIPARTTYTARVRLPFYLIPGDLILASPFLLLFSEKTLENMLVVASNGGLIHWQSGISTQIGRFQFVLGREVAIYTYGINKIRDAVFYLSKNSSGESQTNLVSYKSTMFEFPIIEYRFMKSFSNDQSSSMFMQFYAGVDIPYDIEVLEPKQIETPQFNNIWMLGLRIKFDWRHYF